MLYFFSSAYGVGLGPFCIVTSTHIITLFCSSAYLLGHDFQPFCQRRSMAAFLLGVARLFVVAAIVAVPQWTGVAIAQPISVVVAFSSSSKVVVMTGGGAMRRLGGGGLVMGGFGTAIVERSSNEASTLLMAGLLRSGGLVVVAGQPLSSSVVFLAHHCLTIRPQMFCRINVHFWCKEGRLSSIAPEILALHEKLEIALMKQLTIMEAHERANNELWERLSEEMREITSLKLIHQKWAQEILELRQSLNIRGALELATE